MANIQIKRIYETADPDDGFRVLIDKLWPRGISKEKAKLDLWAKDITPSTELREDFHKGKDPWAEFEKLYKAELLNNPALDDFISIIKDKKMVTLLYGSKDPVHNHAVVLLGVLKNKM